MNSDDAFMQRALALARDTSALASPNPQVGCVLVREDHVLGEGAHLYERRDHAEIVALKDAANRGLNVAGATAYVTLEPCSHHGRTGPCADALIAAGIARCVVATLDPNPQVAGRGVAKLRAAGIEVTLGTGQGEARALNDAFAFSITHGRPFVTLKAALSVDGMLAPPPALRTPAEPFWLTGPEARADVQRLRHGVDALLTGIGTVLADDPLLTDRTGLPRRRPLLRVVLDTHLRLALDSKLAQSAQDDLLVICGREAAPHTAALERAGVQISIVESERGRLPLAPVLRLLQERQVISGLLEAGSSLNGAFLREDLVERVVLFYSETELGPRALPFAEDFLTSFQLEQNLKRLKRTVIGKDVRVSGHLHVPWPDDESSGSGAE